MIAQADQERTIPRPRQRILFAWDKLKAEIVLLVFEGRYSFAQIAQMEDVPLRTLEDWIAHPAFQERLEYMRDNLLGLLMEPGALPYVSKAQRVIALSQMAESARVAYEEHPTIMHPSGAEIFNAPAHTAFRDCLADIAKELGERRRRVPLRLERIPASESHLRNR